MAYFNSKTNNSVSCIELLKGIYNATKQNKQEFEMNDENEENGSKIHIRLITEKTDYECGILD
ncbi:hypothetical protein J4434_04145 [Candidatus Woesearchaeota archaeon]|nr:hypothetical protein [Candidatus Woesearchaeota archaeon]